MTLYTEFADGRLLREAWTKAEPQSFAFDIALTLVDALPVEEAKHYLREGVGQIERAIDRLDRYAEERLREEGSRQPLTGALFDHQSMHLEAELKWTREVLARFVQGAVRV